MYNGKRKVNSSNNICPTWRTKNSDVELVSPRYRGITMHGQRWGRVDDLRLILTKKKKRLEVDDFFVV